MVMKPTTSSSDRPDNEIVDARAAVPSPTSPVMDAEHTMIDLHRQRVELMAQLCAFKQSMEANQLMMFHANVQRLQAAQASLGMPFPMPMIAQPGAPMPVPTANFAPLYFPLPGSV